MSSSSSSMAVVQGLDNSADAKAELKPLNDNIEVTFDVLLKKKYLCRFSQLKPFPFLQEVASLAVEEKQVMKSGLTTVEVLLTNFTMEEFDLLHPLIINPKFRDFIQEDIDKSCLARPGKWCEYDVKILNFALDKCCSSIKPLPLPVPFHDYATVDGSLRVDDDTTDDFFNKRRAVLTKGWIPCSEMRVVYLPNGAWNQHEYCYQCFMK